MRKFEIHDTYENKQSIEDEDTIYAMANGYLEHLNNELEEEEKEYTLNNFSEAINILEMVNIYIVKEVK